MRNKEKSTEFGTKKVRKKYNGNLIMLFALIVVAILLVFAWYLTSTLSRVGGMRYVARSNLAISYITYMGEGHSSTVFDESRNISLEDNVPPTVTLYPGEKQYYKTMLCNYETQSFTGDFYLTNALVNKQLATVQEYGVTTSYVDFTAYKDGDLSTTQVHPLRASSIIKDDAFALVGMQPILEDITIPAGTDTNSDGNADVPGMYTVIWCVELNGDTVKNYTGDDDTTVMNTPLIQYDSLNFVRNS